eukprot:TRINITY_DN70895_c0_g1_i1.p1 TRINITY_DN70895_c0_g1~~TRINITY_DN70895_c0_g1_i1.p1  ORF type:complete len:270 (-),score=25.10 TRINITY_DN70895_c0_g1_i1:161-970(-)
MMHYELYSPQPPIELPPVAPVTGTQLYSPPPFEVRETTAAERAQRVRAVAKKRRQLVGAVNGVIWLMALLQVSAGSITLKETENRSACCLPEKSTIPAECSRNSTVCACTADLTAITLLAASDDEMMVACRKACNTSDVPTVVRVLLGIAVFGGVVEAFLKLMGLCMVDFYSHMSKKKWRHTLMQSGIFILIDITVIVVLGVVVSGVPKQIEQETVPECSQWKQERILVAHSDYLLWGWVDLALSIAVFVLEVASDVYQLTVAKRELIH